MSWAFGRGAIGLALVVLAGCGLPVAPAATVQPLKLKIADGVSPPAALPQSILSLAKQEGFFQRAGLDAEIVSVNGTPAIITAMRAGDVDVGIINSADVIKLDAQKALDLRVIGSPNGRNFWMIVARDNVATLGDLKGKPYAISRVGSEDHALAMTIMAARGVDKSEVNFVAVGVPNVRVQALLANQMTATTTTIGTWVTIRNQPGVKILVTPDEFWGTAPLMSNTSAATANVARDKAEELRRYSKAMLLTARHYAERKEAWVADMGKLRPDIQAADLNELWDQFKSAWAVNGQLNLDTFQKTSDYLYATEDFKDIPRMEAREWIDTRFMDAALGEVGVYPGIDDPGRSVKP
jgi:NitT/TauT family transport system substrate-binding protein